MLQHFEDGYSYAEKRSESANKIPISCNSIRIMSLVSFTSIFTGENRSLLSLEGDVEFGSSQLAAPPSIVTIGICPHIKSKSGTLRSIILVIHWCISIFEPLGDSSSSELLDSRHIIREITCLSLGHILSRNQGCTERTGRSQCKSNYFTQYSSQHNLPIILIPNLYHFPRLLWLW